MPVAEAKVLRLAMLEPRLVPGGEIRVGHSDDGAVVLELDPGAAEVLARVIAMGSDFVGPVVQADEFDGIVADVIASAARADMDPPRLALVSGYLPPRGTRP